MGDNVAGKHRDNTSIGLWIFTGIAILVFVVGIISLISDR